MSVTNLLKIGLKKFGRDCFRGPKSQHVKDTLLALLQPKVFIAGIVAG